MPGFFDTFQDTSSTGGLWVGKDEKEGLIEAGTAFVVTKVAREEGQWGERYVATCVIDGAERLISFPFGTVDSRDRMLGALEKWLEDEANEAPKVKLAKAGRAILIQAA